jgi:DNA polymerase I-like protein with 3'-5' exonuclease and polymerase domains
VLAYWQPDHTTQTCPVCNGEAPPVILTKAGKPKKQKKCKGCDDARTIQVQGGKLVYNNELKEASREIIEILKTKKLVMHNAPFDCEITNRTFKIELMESVHTDTMLLAHLNDENVPVGLKERGAYHFGDSATEEKELMKASVIANGGVWKETGEKEMYKADKDLIARYGAKDTILTLKLLYAEIPALFDQQLDKFFYEDETMPLLRGPTYQLNTVGLKVDVPKLKALGAELEDECTKLTREVETLVAPYIDETWPFGEGKKFSVSSNQHIAWLLFTRLGEYFSTLTKGGKVVAKSLCGRVPYDNKAKRELVEAMKASDIKPWKYQQADAETLEKFQDKYEWIKKLLELRAAAKILSTYVQGILRGCRYGIINPSFLQAGTKTGRYSSKNPNFQNLPRDDKRIKGCIIARPGRVLVGADYSQLEPRVFASVSQDPDLMGCFAKGEDFYSVVGAPIFGKEECSLIKSDPNSFAKKHEDLRNISKAFALATPYGTSAFQQAQKLNLPQKRCQEIIDNYLSRYSSVYDMMLESYEMVKRDGVVFNLYGRPRRLPEALDIAAMYGDAKHGELPYEARSILNQAMNFRVQGSAGSIVNRAMIAFYNECKRLGLDAKIVMQIHDEIVVECAEEIADQVVEILKHAMEKTTVLPGVELIAEPKIATVLADLK